MKKPIVQPKKRGPAPKPPEERHRQVSTKVPPHVYDHLVARGGGSLSRGLRIVAVEAAEKNSEIK